MEEQLEELLALREDFAQSIENVGEEFAELLSIAAAMDETINAILKLKED